MEGFMSNHICTLYGSRGRTLEVYDNKCCIITDVTVGSFLTSNALDGKKTIFYIDIVGIQFKLSGLTLGYLQFENASMQMNNKDSNMFSENTFTFEEGRSKITNHVMKKVHEYIVDRIEGYKYNFIPKPDSLHALLDALDDANISANSNVVNQYKQYKDDRKNAILAQKQQQEEAKKQQMLELKQKISESGKTEQLSALLTSIHNCNSIKDINEVYSSSDWNLSDTSDAISKLISDALKVERMFGVNRNNTRKLAESITALLDNER